MATNFSGRSCYSQRKVKNSESKSQPNTISSLSSYGCYSQRKVKNSESKSQPAFVTLKYCEQRMLLFTA